MALSSQGFFLFLKKHTRRVVFKDTCQNNVPSKTHTARTTTTTTTTTTPTTTTTTTPTTSMIAITITTAGYF